MLCETCNDKRVRTRVSFIPRTVTTETAARMTPASNIFLIGPMACGKTTLGRHLAARLDHEFCDSDDVVQQRAGATVAEIFERAGEGGFRRYETAVLAELTKKQGLVLATGGGAVLSQKNRRRLRERGVVVYLRVGTDTQLARIGNDRSRPLLHGRDRRATLARLNRLREDLYRRIADIVIAVDNKSVRTIGDEIVAALPPLRPSGCAANPRTDA